MNEKTYRTMKKTGAGNIVLGVIVMVVGIVCGILTIVGGAKLIRQKSELIF